jgi:hypothetical protein
MIQFQHLTANSVIATVALKAIAPALAFGPGTWSEKPWRPGERSLIRA